MSKNKKKRRKNGQRQLEPNIDRSADEVEFAREPGAADEVEFEGGAAPDFAADEVDFAPERGALDDEADVEFGREVEALGAFDRIGITPGAPNPTDAVEIQGAVNDADRGEEIREKTREARMGRDEDVEAATEVSPVGEPLRRERNEEGDDKEARDEGNGLGAISIILSVLSFFFVPFLLGSAGIVLGVISGRRGSRLGWWAVGLGAVAVIITAFLAPIAGF